MKFSRYINLDFKHFAIIALLSAVLFSVSSCKKIDGVKSQRLATDETNWKKLEDARANLLSVYGLMRTATVSDNTHWLMGDLRKGDFAITNRADLKAIVNDQLNAQYPVLNRITNWRRFYAVVNAAGLFIERSKEIIPLDNRYTKLQNDIEVAQARMVRAMAYFYMVRLWGDVPLITASHDGDFTKVPRTSKDKVLAFVNNELLTASQIVPFMYGSKDPIFPGNYYGGTSGEWAGVIFTRYSAYSLLAHVAAWQGAYLDAANYSKFVLDNFLKTDAFRTSGNYIQYLVMDALTENQAYNSPFLGGRPTLIVGFPFSNTDYGTPYSVTTNDGHIEQLTLASPYVPKTQPEMYVSKDTILKAFTDPKDLRFSIDPQRGTYRNGYFANFESTEQPIFAKIKVFLSGQTKANLTLFGSSMVFSRLEDMALMRAEACAALGMTSEAVTALNAYAEQRGITKYDPAMGGNLIDAVFAERRRELMGEGHRWYDLVRYNRLKKSTAIFASKNGQDLTFSQFEAMGGIYWPISQDVIKANPLIQQNSYWK